MDTCGIEELTSLIAAKSNFCISIFFPTCRGGSDLKQNQVRFKKLIQKAKVLLIEKGWKKEQAEKFLRPLKSLLTKELPWKHPSEGVALFLNQDLFLFYRLPLHFQEQVMVDERFLIRPLLPLLDNRRFYVLAISENKLRFLKGSLLGIEELQVKTVPPNLQYAMRFDDPERQLQYHSQTPRIPGARAAAIFHGQGVGIDDEKDDLQEYCRQVDRGLHWLLKNENAPLVVATVEALFSTYSKMNTYPHLMQEAIWGNPELLTNDELKDRAWSIVSSHFEKQTKELLKSYTDLAGTNLVTNNVEEILSAARQGRVQHLLVNSDQPWWGRYFPETGKVESQEQPQPTATEIVNLILLEALETRSKIHEVRPPSPEYPSLLAIYRY